MNHDGGRIKKQTMGGQNRKFVRFHNDVESEKGSESESLYKSFSLERTTTSMRRGWERSSSSLRNFGRTWKSPFTRVFTEDHHANRTWILDPRKPFVQRWNQLFVVACLVAVFVDPLFFYLPIVSADDICIHIDRKLAVVVTVLRTCTDTWYLVHMILQFRTAYIAPSSRVFGRGELVTDPQQIVSRYLKKDFWLDFIAVLPLPQVVIWIFIPLLKGNTADKTKNSLRFIVFLQYLPRLFRIFPLTSQMVKTTGVVMVAWAGAAYNLILYMLASHVVGASWYLLAVERQDTCWRHNCREEPLCRPSYFDCGTRGHAERIAWFSLQNQTLINNCNNVSSQNDNAFNYGLYINAITYNITTSTPFLDKYFYCLWFGLLNLSSLGQTLQVSTYFWEIVFAIAIVIAGLLLFALLIGNMQTYLQSLTVRLDEMRVKRRDTEQWMRHRQLPPDLKDRVRRFDQYKWVATRGVDEGNLIHDLPLDLRRDIKRHLCLDLVRRVPLFDQMDDRLLDAICERLRPALNTQETFIVREGDPVSEMLFIIRGKLESATTNGGRTGFFNVGTLNPGDFCGEELLTWALDPRPSRTFPSSTRTVKALVEVEAFALHAEDLKFVAGQFRKLHSKQLQHTFRYYSHQWRTWAACFVQAAWRRFKRRKLQLAEQAEEAEHPTKVQDDLKPPEEQSGQDRAGSMSPSLGATMLVSRFAANARRSVQRLRSMHAAEMAAHLPNIPKPPEPDFSVDED